MTPVGHNRLVGAKYRFHVTGGGSWTYMGVRCDDFESGLDSFGSGATTNVQEVGRATAVELDNVHGSHGKTSTVDKTTNGTVETNVVEVVLGSLDFTRVLLSGVTEGKGV